MSQINTTINTPYDCPYFKNTQEIFNKFIESRQTSIDIIALSGMCSDTICPIRSQCVDTLCYDKNDQEN